jgi:Uncharacterized protein conserved in bacteria (DUF2332)
VRAAVIGNEPERRTAEDYRRFAARQACGRSPLYEDLAKAVADDAELLAFLDELPREKRQPNLLLATVRYLAGVQACYESFRAVVLERRAEVAATMLARRTQTNEPARCATLLPALASLRQAACPAGGRGERGLVPAARSLQLRLRLRSHRR